MASNKNKLRRSDTEKVVGGVCGGLAEWFGWDVTIVRLVYALVSIFTAAGFPGFIIYVILWISIPSEEATSV